LLLLILWRVYPLIYPPKQDDAGAQNAPAASHYVDPALLHCGTGGWGNCECRGEGVTIRYLKRGQSAKIRTDDKMNFDPEPSPTTFVLCDPEDRTRCVSSKDKNLRVGVSLLVVNVSDRTQNISCEYD
jgi:hypothetical protein